MFVVIRLKGRVGVNKEIEDTLAMLRLHRKMHAVLLNDKDSVKGMIQKVKDYVTWGEISDEMLRKMILKRGRKAGNKKLEEKDVDIIFDEIKNRAPKEWSIKPVFRLTPPSKGFRKGIKHQYPNGELGYRGEKINELVKRMI